MGGNRGPGGDEVWRLIEGNIKLCRSPVLYLERGTGRADGKRGPKRNREIKLRLPNQAVTIFSAYSPSAKGGGKEMGGGYDA